MAMLAVVGGPLLLQYCIWMRTMVAFWAYLVDWLDDCMETVGSCLHFLIRL
jgi:hypothetical protein